MTRAILAGKVALSYETGTCGNQHVSRGKSECKDPVAAMNWMYKKHGKETREHGQGRTRVKGAGDRARAVAGADRAVII